MAKLWLPDSDQWFVGPVVAIVLSVIALVVVSKVSAKVSIDVLEFVDPDKLKESAKNIWANVGVTAALVLTIVMAMLQADPISPGFGTNEDMEDVLATIQDMYVALLLVSLMFVLFSVLVCVVNLVYVEPLSNEDAIKYFIANKRSIGAPTIHLMTSVTFQLMAIVLWAFGTYGAHQGTIAVLVTVVIFGGMSHYIWDKSIFDPRSSQSGGTKWSLDWEWTAKEPGEWPEYVHAMDERTRRVLVSLGRHACRNGKDTDH